MNNHYRAWEKCHELTAFLKDHLGCWMENRPLLSHAPHPSHTARPLPMPHEDGTIRGLQGGRVQDTPESSYPLCYSISKTERHWPLFKTCWHTLRKKILTSYTTEAIRASRGVLLSSSLPRSCISFVTILGDFSKVSQIQAWVIGLLLSYSLGKIRPLFLHSLQDLGFSSDSWSS